MRGSDGESTSPPRRGLIAQARPGAVDFLQLAESRPLKTFNRAFCTDLFRGRAELPVELLPREAQRGLYGECPVREPEVQIEAERRPLHRLEDMQVDRYRMRDDLVEKLLPELDRAVPQRGRVGLLRVPPEQRPISDSARTRTRRHPPPYKQ